MNHATNRTHRSGERVDWARVVLGACRRIEAEPTPLAQLAAALGVGRAELQRQFSRRLGVSPKAYAQALALQRLARGAAADRGDARSRGALHELFEAGFGAAATGYAAARALGTTPGRLRQEFSLGWWLGLTELKWMLLGATERGVCWLAFGDSPAELHAQLRAAFPRARLRQDEARLRAWFEQVREHLLLPREALTLPLDVRGTAFQSRVWRALRTVPLGETVSYGGLAAQLGVPRSARAVAAACARNPAAVVIPCHRVVGADGALTGYRWGLARKRRLLDYETAAVSATRTRVR